MNNLTSKPPARSTAPDGFVERLRQILGTKGLVDDAQAIEPYLTEERGLYRGCCIAVVRPSTTEEVGSVVHLCAEMSVSVVPQGGNTGLVGGGVPDGGIVLSTERLNRIRAIDPVNRTITVEAGVILTEVQAAALEVDALFPLSLAAEGSCRIGGNLATNAGGLSVLRYGNARDLVLGLEVVLPDGRVWDGLRGLRKNNTGYDLKQMFLGAEGTLGIITAAELKLFPPPRVSETAMAAVADAAGAVELYHRTASHAGDALTAFEFIDQRSMAFCLAHIPGVVDPFQETHGAYALMRLTSPRTGDPLRDAIETILEQAFNDGLVEDAVIAENNAQADALWRLRESIPEAQKAEGGSIKNDISVPISRIPEFIQQATAAVESAIPGIRVVAFGHLGDGNLHFNLSQPEGADRDAYMAEWHRIDRLVADIAIDLGGSFSAEHGIGRLKRPGMVRYKSAVELDLMRAIKRALDPHNLMNPGKVIPDDGAA